MLALSSRPQTSLFVHVLKENVIKRNRLDGFMIYQKHFTIWQSSSAPISKCLFYGKRPGILLIRASHPGEKMRRSPGHGGHLKDEQQNKKNISVDHFFSLRNGRRFELFFFGNASKQSLKAKTLRRWFESDLRRPLRKEQTLGGKQCLTKPQQRPETME